MAIYVHGVESGALRRRLREVEDSIDPRSRKMDRLRSKLGRAAVKDNTEKLLGYGSGLAGVDRFGRGLAPLGDWAYGAAFRRRGNGPVLAPRGLQSRAITAFRATWVFQGGAWRLIQGWRGIPWMLYHLEGRAHGSKSSQPNWHLPKRDIGGMSPRGWVEWRGVFADFNKTLHSKS
jgi:hypothetical protein